MCKQYNSLLYRYTPDGALWFIWMGWERDLSLSPLEFVLRCECGELHPASDEEIIAAKARAVLGV